MRRIPPFENRCAVPLPCKCHLFAGLRQIRALERLYTINEQAVCQHEHRYGQARPSGLSQIDKKMAVNAIEASARGRGANWPKSSVRVGALVSRRVGGGVVFLVPPHSRATSGGFRIVSTLTIGTNTRKRKGTRSIGMFFLG